MTSPMAIRFTLRQFLLGFAGLAVAFAICAWLITAVRDARRAALASSAQGPLNQLQLALCNYHEVHGRFPPAYVADDDGTPMHSWRVLILPYVEERALYDAYDFTEPWNGPHNGKLAGRMPRVFHSPSEPDSNAFTNIVAITGPGTAFPGRTGTMLSAFTDGPENTILLAEIADSTVPWLQPVDLRLDGPAAGQLPGPQRMSAARWRRPLVVFADQIRAYGVRRNIPPSSLRALTTIAGGEPITRSRLVEQGYLD